MIREMIRTSVLLFLLLFETSIERFFLNSYLIYNSFTKQKARDNRKQGHKKGFFSFPVVYQRKACFMYVCIIVVDVW